MLSIISKVGKNLLNSLAKSMGLATHPNNLLLSRLKNFMKKQVNMIYLPS